MKVGNYKIFWNHGRNTTEEEILPKGGFTKCIIENENREKLSSAYSVCSQEDNYNKNIGRKLSLQRALSKMSIEKQERQKFFDVYLETIGK